MKRKPKRGRPAIAWAALWHSESLLDGVTMYLIRDPVGVVKLARTRREIREFSEQKYGYIKRRPDLRGEPHGWRFPKAVRVRITEL